MSSGIHRFIASVTACKVETVLPLEQPHAVKNTNLSVMFAVRRYRNIRACRWSAVRGVYRVQHKSQLIKYYHNGHKIIQ